LSDYNFSDKSISNARKKGEQMGHHTNNRDDYDDESNGDFRLNLNKIKKKALLFGCGCFVILVIIVILVMAGAASGIKNLIMPAISGIVSQIPKYIPLPEGVRIPTIPPGLFKLTPEEQIKLGREVANQEGLDQNTFADKTIDSVSARLIKALPSQYKGPQASGWEWQFRRVNTKEGIVNAMALPGGKIYMYDGLMKLSNNDPNQLALILGHEMGHVVEEHSAEQIRSAGMLQTVAGLIANNAGGGEGQITDVISIMATKLGKDIIGMQLSQKDEYQADSLGLQFMRNAGYDPKKGIVILEKMDKLSQSKGANNPILGRIFSTHPPMKDRIAKLKM
jgi:hypothetical protein